MDVIENILFKVYNILKIFVKDNIFIILIVYACIIMTISDIINMICAAPAPIKCKIIGDLCTYYM